MVNNNGMWNETILYEFIEVDFRAEHMYIYGGINSIGEAS